MVNKTVFEGYDSEADVTGTARGTFGHKLADDIVLRHGLPTKSLLAGQRQEPLLRLDDLGSIHKASIVRNAATAPVTPTPNLSKDDILRVRLDRMQSMGYDGVRHKDYAHLKGEELARYFDGVREEVVKKYPPIGERSPSGRTPESLWDYR